MAFKRTSFSSLVEPQNLDRRFNVEALVEKFPAQDEWGFSASNIQPIPLNYLYEVFSNGVRLYFIKGKKVYTYPNSYYNELNRLGYDPYSESYYSV